MEKHVTFPVGDIMLEGLVRVPDGATIAAVVCHPHPLYGGEMLNNVVAALVKGLGAAGIATLRFNFRGVGRSGGSHDDGNAEQDDVKAAVTCLLQGRAFETIAVAGYSFGSMVGLKAGADDPRVDKLIGVALPIARRDASFLAGVTKPKLLISGDCDDISPVSQMQRLVDGLAEPKAFVVVPGADHFFGGMERRVVEAAVRFLAA